MYHFSYKDCRSASWNSKRKFYFNIFFNNRNNQITKLAKNKLNSIENLVSQALINLEISHEEFVMILKERDKYEKMKENFKNFSEKQKNMKLNGVNSRSSKNNDAVDNLRHL